MDLHVFWYWMLGVLLAGYAVLDGFDLGVGVLHFLARGDRERRVFVNAIGPLWDGNEVWLITFGGILFAIFPHVYATVFSGFYLAFILLLVALIFRAVSLEFRSKRESASWRRFWDAMFFGGSAVAALLFGVAVGNIVRGVPVGADREFAGTFLGLLHPYPLLIGALTVGLFAAHGAFFLDMKTEGELRERIRRAIAPVWTVYTILWIAATAATFAASSAARTAFRDAPYGFALLLLGAAVLVLALLLSRRDRPGRAFLFSSLHVLTQVGLLGFVLFPNLVISSLNPEWNLTIYNASSSAKALRVMTIIISFALPLVILYSFVLYRSFRGKVRIDENSY